MKFSFLLILFLCPISLSGMSQKWSNEIKASYTNQIQIYLQAQDDAVVGEDDPVLNSFTRILLFILIIVFVGLICYMLM